ncbi:MAG TPA: DoxX family protein [Kofleriaceae bacterium]|jgi:uncharacterized membrane protein YphA (DoxX/SURF4 family)
MATRSKAIVYWLTTSTVALVLVSGGIASVLRLSENVAGMASLGYPAYMLSILGVWKLLGGATLLAPRLPRLKEWAYAGTIFDLTGAAASWLACSGPIGHVLSPLVVAVIALASWALRPESRRLA